MLDLRGAGTDLLIAAQMVGAGGRDRDRHDRNDVERAATSAREMGLEHVELHEGLIESPRSTTHQWTSSSRTA